MNCSAGFISRVQGSGEAGLTGTSVDDACAWGLCGRKNGRACGCMGSKGKKQEKDRKCEEHSSASARPCACAQFRACERACACARVRMC
eukprot:5463911-Pleurochrysis_carterae.AAC.1